MEPPLRATPERYLFTRWWWGEAALVGLLGAIFAIAVLSDPSAQSIHLFGAEVPELCVWKRMTGHSCPGCGLTRSFSYMGEADLWSAFKMHPLGPPIFLGMLYQLVYSASRMVWGPGWIPPWTRWWRSSRRRR